MKTWLIVSYAFGWNYDKHLGFIAIVIRDQNNQESALEINFTDMREFTAVATVLREKPVYYREDGYVFSGSESSIPQ